MRTSTVGRSGPRTARITGTVVSRKRWTVVEALNAYGYSVSSTENGREALDFLADNRPVDLLLTDVLMPHLNGRDLVRQVRVARPDLRVLFTSGYISDVTFDATESMATSAATPSEMLDM